MDAGVLTFPNFSNAGLGVPGSGFASKGKGSHIKPLSVVPPEQNRAGGINTPRTSRGHLLAGLRTAARTNGAPPSAPPMQTQHRFGGLNDSRYAESGQRMPSQAFPQTAVGSGFPHLHRQQSLPQQTQYNLGNNQVYSVPEQVMGPPDLSSLSVPNEEAMDPHIYAELVATNQYLAQQQRKLQEQLMNITAAAQGLNLSGQMDIGQAQAQAAAAARNGGFYAQNLGSASLQPIITPIPGAQPGLCTITDPMTGQQSFFLDPNMSAAAQQNVYGEARQERRTSPPMPETPRVEVSPPPPSNPVPINFDRAISPPKSVSPPQQSTALPPPSATAFRRGHKKATSLAFDANRPVSEGPKTSIPKASHPVTPMTGTFGPGQARAGEHPVRQPRGPPPLEDLIAKPTAKVEGSKNFSSRQRRRAVHNLVRAGLERRGAQSSPTGSTGSSTPVSDKGQGTLFVETPLSGKRSFSALVSNGRPAAIGSERKETPDRSSSPEPPVSLAALRSGSSEDVPTFASKSLEAKPEAPERRRTPMLVLTSAEKRKSSVF